MDILLNKKVMLDTKLEIESLTVTKRGKEKKKKSKRVKSLERYYKYLDNKFN